MEATKKSARKTGSKASGEKIKSAYTENLLTTGVRPVSVYKFCVDAKIKENDFYDHFGSFDALERSVWKGFIDKTIVRLRTDKSFHEFSSREKILALYFTLLEELRTNRSFILVQLDSFKKLEIVPSFLKDFKSAFEAFIETLLAEGKSKGEIATRPYLD